MNLTILKEFFAGFLRTRHIARHFRRLALLENLLGTGVSQELPPTLAQKLVSASKSDTEILLKQLESHSDGLTEAQAEAIRKARWSQRSRTREAAAVVATPVVVLSQPVQSAADAAGGHLLSNRRYEGNGCDRHHGGVLDVTALLTGSQGQQGC